MDRSSFVFLCFCLSYLPGINCEKEVRQALQSIEQRMLAMENSLETCGCSPHTPVAFRTFLSHTITPAADQIIVFDDVQLNLGNAYHVDNGIFLVPRNGLYMFSLSVCSYPNHYIVVDLVKDGTLLGRALAGDASYADCSSETSIVQLNAGDQIYLKHHGTSGDYLHYDKVVPNSFTGVLLQPM